MEDKADEMETPRLSSTAEQNSQVVDVTHDFLQADEESRAGNPHTPQVLRIEQDQTALTSFKKGLKSRARERLGVLEQKLKFLENLEGQLKMVEFFPSSQQNASSPDQNGEFSVLPNAVVTDALVASHRHASDDHNHDAYLHLDLDMDQFRHIVREEMLSKSYEEISLKRIFGGFSRTSPIRLKCFQIVTSKEWNSFFLIATVLNSVTISLAPEFPKASKTTQTLDIIGYACGLAFFFEVTCGIIAYGFWHGPTTYMNLSDFNRLDFFLLLTLLAEYFAEFALRLQGPSIRSFRLLRLLKYMMRMRLFSNVRAMIQTLRQGMSQILIVAMVLAFFVAMFGIFGMAIYQNSFARRCLMAARNVSSAICASDASNNWSKTCSFNDNLAPLYLENGSIAVYPGYPGMRWCKIYCTDPVSLAVLALAGVLTLRQATCPQYAGVKPQDSRGWYHSCQEQVDLNNDGVVNATDLLYVDQYCESIGNPQFGLQNFDSLGGVIPTILQVAAPDSSYDVILESLQSEPSAIILTWFFYVAITVLCTFLILGLFVAVVTGTFARVRERHASISFEDSIEQVSEPKQRSRHDGVAGVGHLERQRTSQTFPTREELGIKSTIDAEADDGESVLQNIAYHLLFETRLVHFISFVILIDVLMIAISESLYSMEAQSQMSSRGQWSQAAVIVSSIAVAIFAIELVLRYSAYGGIKEFWRRRNNKAESILVILNVIGLILDSKFLTFLAVLRMYRLMIYFPTLYNLLASAIASGSSIFNLVCFIALIALCYAVAGRYSFAGAMVPYTRSNFGTFPQSLLTIFQLLVGDSWSGVLYQAMQVKVTLAGRFFAAFFVLSWFIFGRLIISNLFIAVIIENFNVSDTITHFKQPGYISNIRQVIKKSYSQLYQLHWTLRGAGRVIAYDPETDTWVPRREIEYTLTQHTGNLDASMMEYASKAYPHLATLVSMSVLKTEKEELDQAGSKQNMERVLLYFHPFHPARRFCTWLIKQPAFDLVIFASIIVGCILLVTAPPYDDIPGNAPLLDPVMSQQLNNLFTFIFTVEFICRVMCHGLLFTKNAYLKSGWNIMDSVVLLFSWIDVSNVMTNGKIAKVFRLGRALRPLRLMKRNIGMRILIDALIGTLAPVWYVIVFMMISFVVFAIVGMSLFGRKLYRCTDADFAAFPGGKSDCCGLSADLSSGILYPRAWVRPYHNFDTFGDAFLTLFRINTIKYVGILADVVDITGENLSPQENHSMVYSLFFVIYLIFGALFTMNLLVGFIVDGFNLNAGSSEAEIFYNRLMRYLKDYKPRHDRFPPPSNALSTWMRTQIASQQFQTFSMGCVFTNVIFMLSDHANADSTYLSIYDFQNNFFFWELFAEIALNLVAYGIFEFWNDRWKMFDALVLLGASLAKISSQGAVSKAARAARVARVLRLMKMFRPLRVILETLVSSVPQLSNILFLLFLFYTMFAVVFIQIFATTKNGQRLGPTANFADYMQAWRTIYQMIIGDEWMTIMDDCRVQPPACTKIFSTEYDPYYHGKSYSFGDCGSPFAVFWFPLFILICQAILLNLFIGMILDNFAFITDQVAEVEDEEWEKGASSGQVMEISRIFQEFTLGSSYVGLASVHVLMRQIPTPLGFKTRDGKLRFGKEEKTAEKLIRAELNVLSRQRRIDSMKTQKANVIARIRNMIMQRFLKTEDKYLTRISFEELVLTMLYWRKPTMVPREIRRNRVKQVKEVVHMLHALTLKDFFLSLVNHRLKKEMNKALAPFVNFVQWSSTDPHYGRRREHFNRQKSEVKKRALKDAMYRGVRFSAPAQVLEFTFLQLHELPNSFVPHQEMVKSDLHVKFPRASHGLLLFKQRVKTSQVVLKYMDSKNERKGMVKVDLRQCNWQGWEEQESERDVFFLPHNRQTRLDERMPSWDQVDILEPMDAWNDESEKVLVGSIVDVQSFTTWTQLNNAGMPRDPVSVLRLNLGRHESSNRSSIAIERGSDKTSKDARVEARRRSEQAKVKQLGDIVYSATLEVLGYIP
ncbi:hypothetical protein GUITHDRAFT_132377 [Guillardia theta CCMP2712]|uniref:Ion transport domain-containing protein n=1 Tax=Guillardia theta (strain CCMP2712) TaxID=905079 RepID=L1K061_GUITC|nr:hypothetical protein GUITHDRAFT_132377 [Guillardia theta CCMP2712]EKX53939.1 hypothetical protein GUITHDRAFT_132377 [Guillardia theta CCMP2712]|eukprot:XP_005840919.1 hypothetical protein GUITHDRAFT_132377 [Guillardia theta CCMP2712]